MLSRRHWIACIVAVAGTTVCAQEAKDQPEPRRVETKQETTKHEVKTKSSESEQVRDCVLLPSTRVEGAAVMGKDDILLGNVKDVIVRGSSGRVVYLLVSKGTEPTYGRIVPVPYAAFNWDHDRRVLNLPVTESQFKAATTVDAKDWRMVTDPNAAVATYRYFRVADDRATEDRKVYRVRKVTRTDGDKTTETTVKETEKTVKQPEKQDRQPALEEPALKRIGEEGSLVRVSEIRNHSLLTQDGNEAGTVNDVVFDGDSGQIAFLVITPSARMNAGDGRIGVPWPSFEVEPGGRMYVLDLDAETLRAAPRFTQAEWAELHINGYTSDMYKRYGYDSSRWDKTTTRQTTTTTRRETTETSSRDNKWRENYRTALTSGSPRTVKGRVESIDQSRDGVTVYNIKTDDGETVVVHTAPKAYLDEHQFAVRNGDTVTVIGKTSDMDGKKCLCATEVVAADGKRVVVHPVDGKLDGK